MIIMININIYDYFCIDSLCQLCLTSYSHFILILFSSSSYAHNLILTIAHHLHYLPIILYTSYLYEPQVFVVRHYAGDVDYNPLGLLVSGVIELHIELHLELHKRSLFRLLMPPWFKSSLLMAVIRSTASHVAHTY
jgi:hypothetical protein